MRLRCIAVPLILSCACITALGQTDTKLSIPDKAAQAKALGVVKEGAFADLLLVEGNPLEDIKIIADPWKNFSCIMKDGKFYKNKFQKEEVDA